MRRIAAALLMLLHSSDALSWEANIDGAARNESEAVRDLAIDLTGDVLVAGELRNGGTTDDDFVVVKLSRGTGRELWRREIDGTAPFFSPGNKDDRAFAVAADTAGDVLAAAVFKNEGTFDDFGVVKLSGTTGEVVWRRDFTGAVTGSDAARAIAVDAAGDVVAAGTILNDPPGVDFTMIKLSGQDGEELWRFVIPSTGGVGIGNVIVDSSGDVVAIANITNASGTTGGWTVVKIAGADGTQLWRQIISGTASNGADSPSAVALDHLGDVVAAGVLENVGSFWDLAVVKLSGIDGSELWRAAIDGLSPEARDGAHAVAVDDEGDVIATGEIRDAAGFPEFSVVKLASVDGALLWSRNVGGPGGTGIAVMVDDSGEVVAAGQPFIATKLSSSTGAPVWFTAIPEPQVNTGALDSVGDVIVAGQVIRDGEGAIGVFKLSGLDGSDFSIVQAVSYGAEPGEPSSLTFDGGAVTVRPSDGLDIDAASLVFDAFPESPAEDIDAIHVLPNGNVIFSTATRFNHAFGGLAAINAGDLIEWDGTNATLLFSESSFDANQNIDAFSIHPNENWLLSTDETATLGGLTFDDGDVVEYDPVAKVASLFLSEGVLFTGSPQDDPDIDALHMRSDGSLVFSIRDDGVGMVGSNFVYGPAGEPRSDLVLFDPSTDLAGLFLDGDELFDDPDGAGSRTGTRNLDAVSLPEPSFFTLLSSGIVWIISIAQRRIRR